MATPTLAELKTRRDTLQTAIDSGVLSVKEGDKTVGYRSAEAMASALAGLNRRIDDLEGTKRPRGAYPKIKKGW